MTRYAILPAMSIDAVAMASDLRGADVREIRASTGMDPLSGMLSALRMSERAWSGWADGRRVCLFGVAPMTMVGDVGVPWMVGTRELERHATAFLRRNREVLPVMGDGFRAMVNWVDARNRLAVRWLSWLGFRIGAAEPFGPFNLPFHRFEMEVSRCAS